MRRLNPDPRPWDGRVRRVMEIVERKYTESGKPQYTKELLECGHVLKVMSRSGDGIAGSSMGKGTGISRICTECEVKHV